MTDRRAALPDLSPIAWFKASASGSSNACVEVARLPRTLGTGIRDSKHRTSGTLTVPPNTWSAFVAGVRSGHL